MPANGLPAIVPATRIRPLPARKRALVTVSVSGAQQSGSSASTRPSPSSSRQFPQSSRSGSVVEELVVDDGVAVVLGVALVEVVVEVVAAVEVVAVLDVVVVEVAPIVVVVSAGGRPMTVMTWTAESVSVRSIVGLDADAVLVTAPSDTATVYDATIVREAPGAIAPTEHGNAVVQSPEVETNRSPAGVGSSTTTSAALEGPALETTIVYSTWSPGSAEAGPSLVIDRSASGAMSVSTVDVLLARSTSSAPGGGVTVAVFSRLPVASGSSVPRMTKGMLVPGRRSRRVSTLPLPTGGRQVAPRSLPVQNQVTFCSAAGTRSVTGAPTIGLGPSLRTIRW